MNIIHVIILGIVEGITEFLPVSSTFHLIWTSQLLSLPQSDFVKLFQVVIQGGAIGAVILLYWKEVLTNLSLMKKLMVSFIPTAIIGLMLYKLIKDVFFESMMVTTVVFIVVGILFILIERYIKAGKLSMKLDISKLTYKDALLIGVFQALAVVPGVSRAGAVLVGMMILGYRRDESAKYSFILSIPTILAAAALDLLQMRDIAFASIDTSMVLLLGLGIAFISSLICVKWLITYLQNHSLELFGWYRIAVGILLLAALVA
ncbi:MAG: undecaprenyl-diphosphate phosphatase [Candidatus Roizmanbacteria bacterium]|nr:undecaprenyl-diphosphate phosphatase [Candidatus Roizmanbacteria bacterium]